MSVLTEVTTRFDAQAQLYGHGSKEDGPGQRFESGYLLLGEIDRLIGASNKDSTGGITFSPEAVAFVRSNEFTGALEAVTRGALSVVSGQEWDNKSQSFTAFGLPIIKHITQGAEAIEHRRSDPSVGYEYDRRRAEVEEQERIDQMFLQNAAALTMLVVSPYPEEVSDTAAASFGYNPQEKTAMLRWHVISKDGKKETYTLSLSNSSKTIFQKLLARLGAKHNKGMSTTDILATRSDKLINPPGILSVIDVAKVYDSILGEDRGGDTYYFLGKKVSGPEEQRYDQLEAQRQVFENQAEPLIDWLVSYDQELAKSLIAGSPTETVGKSILQASRAKNTKGEHVISKQERTLLESSPTLGFTRRHAELLKKHELLRVWSELSILANPQRAREIFGQDRVIQIEEAKRAYEKSKETLGFSDSWYESQQRHMILNRMIAEVNPVFYACGGGVGQQYKTNLFNESLAVSNVLLFGSNETWSYHTGECVVCEKKNTQVGPCNICKVCEKKFD